MTYLTLLKAQLIVDEGRENKMYKDSVGVPTIGIGHNLRDDPISDAAVDQIFIDDIAPIEAECRKLYPVFDVFSDARKAAVMNMCFNLGEGGLAGFNTFNAMMNAGQYVQAADDLKTTLWSKQVGARAVRIETAIREG